MSSKHETERTMLDRLRARYGRTFTNGSYVGRRYVIAEHVPTRPGAWGGDRIADAIVLDTWAAAAQDLTEKEKEAPRWGQRQSVHGFEVKTSRSDWLTELRDPEKADAWARYCHYFWLVAASKDIVRDDLPDGWGLLVPHGLSLRVVRKAARRDPHQMPLPVVVAVARAVQKTEVAMAAKRAEWEAEQGETDWEYRYHAVNDLGRHVISGWTDQETAAVLLNDLGEHEAKAWTERRRKAGPAVAAPVVHSVPHPISGLTGCCRRTVFELPRGDRLTESRSAVTCSDRPNRSHDCESCEACLHDGHRCCGCYDGACCQETPHQEEVGREG